MATWIGAESRAQWRATLWLSTAVVESGALLFAAYHLGEWLTRRLGWEGVSRPAPLTWGLLLLALVLGVQRFRAAIQRTLGMWRALRAANTTPEASPNTALVTTDAERAPVATVLCRSTSPLHASAAAPAALPSTIHGNTWSLPWLTGVLWLLCSFCALALGLCFRDQDGLWAAAVASLLAAINLASFVWLYRRLHADHRAAIMAAQADSVTAAPMGAKLWLVLLGKWPLLLLALWLALVHLQLDAFGFVLGISSSVLVPLGVSCLHRKERRMH